MNGRLRALQETVNEGRRHHLADVLGVVQALERDADDLLVEEYRATAVAGVDRSINRDREQPAIRVGVALKLDAADHAFGDRDFLATNREAHDGHFVLQVGKLLPQPGDRGLHPKLFVLDLKQREVGVVAHRREAGDELVRMRAGLNLNEGRVSHHVRAGENHAGRDNHTRAGPVGRARGLPWALVVGLLGGSEDADDGRLLHGRRT